MLNNEAVVVVDEEKNDCEGKNVDKGKTQCNAKSKISKSKNKKLKKSNNIGRNYRSFFFQMLFYFIFIF